MTTTTPTPPTRPPQVASSTPATNRSSPLPRGKIMAWGTLMVELIVAQVAMALGNVDFLGVHPLAFLTAFGQQLQQQASDAYVKAIAAEATANDASAAADTATQTSQDAQQTASGAANQVGSLQNQINTRVSIPIQNSAHDGEQSVDWDTCDTDITISPTQARGYINRIKAPMEKRTCTIIAFRGAGCTAVYFDCIRYDPVAGTATRVYQSVNEVANLPAGSSPATDYATLVHTIPADQAVAVNGTEYWGWQISVVGGNITVRGKTDSNPALPQRPRRRGLVRDSSSVRMPATLTQVQMDAAVSALIPYVEFDGPNDPMPLVFYDDFEREVL